MPAALESRAFHEFRPWLPHEPGYGFIGYHLPTLDSPDRRVLLGSVHAYAFSGYSQDGWKEKWTRETEPVSSSP